MESSIHIILRTSLILSTLLVVAQNKTIHLLEPSRDGKKEQILQIGKNNGTKILAMASCENCMPAAYAFNTEASSASGKDVYGTSGIFVIPYDSNSYVIVAPNPPVINLGDGIWKTFMYANFFSEDKSKVSQMSKAKVEVWAVELSKQIMFGTVKKNPIYASSSTYYPAVKNLFSGKSFNSLKINIRAKEKVTIKLPNGYTEDYMYQSDLSKALSVDVYDYGNNRQQYLFLEANEASAVIWAKYGNGNDLGKSAWGSTESFNYFHKEQNVIRSLLVSKSAQDAIDAKLTKWSLAAMVYKKEIYEAKEAQDAKNRRLPTRGLSSSALEAQALMAAKQWANKYSWEETITKAYFTSDDWSIYRNNLTGKQLGRRISGIIVLKRTDSKCSFHYAQFAQQYNGSGYNKVFTEGITPGQYILDCKNVN